MNQQIGLLQTAMSAMFLAMSTTFMFNDVPHMLDYEGKRAKLVDQFGSWAVGRAESVCPRQDAECGKERRVSCSTRTEEVLLDRG